MTRDEYVNDLRKTYSIVSKLAEKNGCMVLRMRHKTLQKDIVLHSLPQAMPIYRDLMGIRHENLPLIYDCVDLDDGQIILEEFIDGQTVAQVLETGNYKNFSTNVPIENLRIKQIWTAVAMQPMYRHWNSTEYSSYCIDTDIFLYGLFSFL